MTEQVPRVTLPPVQQIGIVVKDMDQAIDCYARTFGWGPFQVQELTMDGFIYRGKKGKCRFKMAVSQSGPVEIELIQILEGETPHTEFLKEKGEGLQHLGFRVGDLDSMLAALAKDGIEPVIHHRMKDLGVAFAYLNSDRFGGVMFELFEMKGE